MSFRSTRALFATFAIGCLADAHTHLSAALAREPSCTGVLSQESDPVGYRLRGNRCEGVIKRQVAAAVNLTIVGAHLDAARFETASSSLVPVSVPRGSPTGSLNLRIISTRPRQLYRMDAALSSAEPFSWPPDVRSNANIRLEAHEVRGLACRGSCDAASPTVVPVLIGSSNSRPEGLQLSFQAAVDLKEVYFTVQQEGSSTPLYADAPVLGNRPVHLANTVLDVQLPLAPGTYQFKLAAEPKAGGAREIYRFKLIVPRVKAP